MNLEIRAVAALLGFFSFFSSAASELFPAYDPASRLVLVNREHPIAYDYVPEPLIEPDVPVAPNKDGYVLLRPEAASALKRLFDAAGKAGHTLYAVSGYRSYALQKSVFRRKVGEVGERAAMRTVAPPGTSEHQTGLVMDINGETTLKKGLVPAFGASPEGKWVRDNAHRFGFIIRYPEEKTEITGYSWEPWHLRYVGEAAAQEIFALNASLEEYLELLQLRRVEAWANPGKENSE